MRQPSINRIHVPADLLRQAALSAARDAAGAFARARGEVALPAASRRPLRAIHGEVLAASRLARQLQQAAGL